MRCILGDGLVEGILWKVQDVSTEPQSLPDLGHNEGLLKSLTKRYSSKDKSFLRFLIVILLWEGLIGYYQFRSEQQFSIFSAESASLEGLLKK